ncbi:hypothetical protein ACJW30_03G179800 [Castanea mollissima]
MIQIETQKKLLILVITYGLLSSTTESIRFELKSSHTKCIAEELKVNSMTVGKYSVVNPNEDIPLPDFHKVSVRVTSSNGNIYHHGDKVPSGKFAFMTVEAGDYMACFSAPDHQPSITSTIDFEWKTGVAAKDWSSVAKKGQVDLMELELKKMYDTVISIQEEMFYLREREEEMQVLNKTTNNRMAWLSFLSLIVCLSVAGLQVWHLKTFFEKKKLI